MTTPFRQVLDVLLMRGLFFKVFAMFAKVGFVYLQCFNSNQEHLHNCILTSALLHFILHQYIFFYNFLLTYPRRVVSLILKKL